MSYLNILAASNSEAHRKMCMNDNLRNSQNHTPGELRDTAQVYLNALDHKNSVYSEQKR